MDLQTAREDKDGKLVLNARDAIALVSGRLLLAWGELDFRIEALLLWTWGEVANRQDLEGVKPDAFPAEGRSGHRLKKLRRYFSVICAGEKVALSQIDRLITKQRELEKLRSAIAHGITLGEERDGEFSIGAWTFGAKERNGSPFRDAEMRYFKMSEVQKAVADIVAVREELELLVADYTRPYTANTVEMMAATSCGLPISQPLEFKTDNPLSERFRIGSMTSAIALSAGVKRDQSGD